MGLDSILEYHRKRNSGEIRKNLDYILGRSYAKAMDDNVIVADDDSVSPLFLGSIYLCEAFFLSLAHFVPSFMDYYTHAVNCRP